MKALNIGIIREEKVPQDTRTPITPKQAREIKKSFPQISIYCQSGNIRCYSDDEYRHEGIEVVDDISHCDILCGVKEVKIDRLLSGKTYFFFTGLLSSIILIFAQESILYQFKA